MKQWIKEACLNLRDRVLRPFYPPALETVNLGSVQSILVLRFDRIGDMVMATPMLEALREEIPNAKISVLASESNAPVLDGNPNVDKVYVLPLRGQKAFLNGFWHNRFDLLVDPYPHYDRTWAKISAGVDARYRLGMDIFGQGMNFNIRVRAPLPPMSASETMLEICRRGLKRPFLSREPKVYVQDGEKDWGWKSLSRFGVSRGRPTVLLHPGGHFPEQRWPAERFAHVATLLDAEGDCAAVLVGGAPDESLLARAERLEPKVKVVRTESLRHLIALLSCARLLICNNSGPLHLACALGLPTLSTLGPTDRALWAPMGEMHRIVERNPLDALKVDQVMKEALGILGYPNGIPQ